MSTLPVIAVTSGEPAGVGPELCLRLAEHHHAVRIVLLGDIALLRARAAVLGTSIQLREWQPREAIAYPSKTLEVLHCPLAQPSLPGQLNPANATYVLAMLDRAVDGCLSGEFAALVTAPVHKGVINQAGITFSGHTEYLAARTACPQVVMLLAGETPHGPLRVALLTTHIPLRSVADAITPERLVATIRLLHAEMRQKFAIAEPRILVAGLNPHAGEGGYLGHEEINTITPAIERLRTEGLHVIGPLPADTLFTPPVLAQGDCVLAMYHDQGLTALKYATFGHGVNISLGLPIVRTSVDHGTALALAGRGQADPGSLFAALEHAIRMSKK